MPALTFAQLRGRVVRIGFLSPRDRPQSMEVDNYGAFSRGMRELGYLEGKDYTIEWRYADGDYNRLPGHAAELVRLNVDVIVATTSPAIRAAQQATSTIPIVFPNTGDPVGSGFVASLAHPGGNITGLSNSNLDVSGKLVELLRIIAPRLSRIAVLVDPGSSTYPAMVKNLQAAAQQVGARLAVMNAGTPEDVERAFASMARDRIGAVVLAAGPFLTARRQQIAASSIKQRLPSISQNSSYPEAGGLMSYGANAEEGFRRAAVYVDKILKGAKPADLPIEQPTTFDLVINAKTAKALGIAIPQEMAMRASRVIE